MAKAVGAAGSSANARNFIRGLVSRPNRRTSRRTSMSPRPTASATMVRFSPTSLPSLLSWRSPTAPMMAILAMSVLSLEICLEMR